MAGNLLIDCRSFFQEVFVKMKKKQPPRTSYLCLKNVLPELRGLLPGIPVFAYFFCLLSSHAYAANIWTQAETIMKDVYNQILGISTIAAIVTASVALLLMNFSKSGRTVDESRAWLKRIIISWVMLNSMGFIMAYVTPFFNNGQWNG